MATVMLAVGSRGDAQPLAVLADALVERGEPARVVALDEYAPLVQRAEFVPIAGRLADAMRRGKVDDTLSRSPLGQMMLLRRWAAGLAGPFAEAALTAAAEGDTVVAGVLARGAAAALADARGCRVATIVYTGQPPTLHRESHFFASYFSGWAPYDRWGTRFNWRVSTSVGSALTHALRTRLGLPRLGFAEAALDADRHPTIVAASPVLVPPAPDWGPLVHQTGFLAPPPEPYAPEPSLTDFLTTGNAVFVGFGSLTGFTSPAEFELLVEAGRLARTPLVLHAHAGLAPGPVDDGVYAVGSVPHGWLFPQVAGIVHHGGAGTTHEGLRSGRPSAAIPFGVDQPYHAARLHELGVGPAPLPLRKLTAARLARLITELTTTPSYAARAAEVAGTVRAEDGVGAAIAALASL